jgi:hypothetical protein
MKISKNLIIAFLVLIVGVTASLAESAYSGTKLHKKYCEEYKSLSSSEAQYSTFYGFEGCEPEEIVIQSALEWFILCVFVFHLILVLLDKNASLERRFAYLGLSAVLLLGLIIFDQILLNSFKHIAYEGWQDAGWTVDSETLLIIDIREFSQRPTAIISTIISTILFTIISTLGVFITGFIYRNIKKSAVAILVMILFSLFVQVAVFLVSFPVSLFFFFSMGG